MKYSLFNQGQFGDGIIATAAARIFKEKYPSSTLFLNINKKYTDIASLFLNNFYFDGLTVWSAYDNWPDDKDKEIIKYRVDISIGHPMNPHKENDWYLYRHQTTECAYMNKIIDKNEAHLLKNGIECSLTKWFDSNINLSGNYVAFFPFAGWYNINNTKKLTEEKAQKIVDLLSVIGYKVLQIGGNDEPQLKNTLKLNTDFFNSVKNSLSCKFAVGTDTAMQWILSAYQFPSIGLYSNQYYGKEFIKNIQPINKNSIYLDAPNVNDILIEDIEVAIKNLIN